MISDLQVQTKLRTLLENVGDLKGLPATVSQTLKMLEIPDISIEKIVSVISIDQALTARILRLANSAYYGFSQPATTLRGAITRLGFRQVKSVLFTASFSSLLRKQVISYNLRDGELLRHSIAAAMIAQRLAERIVYSSVEEAYIGGLLHDIGKLALDQYLHIDWNGLLLTAQKHEMPLIEAEEFLLGLNHAQVGGELAHKWRLPDILVDAIAYHHQPASAAKSPELAAIVHLADIICLRLGIGLGDAYFLPNANPSAMHLLYIDEQELELLTGIYRDLFAKNYPMQEN